MTIPFPQSALYVSLLGNIHVALTFSLSGVDLAEDLQPHDPKKNGSSYEKEGAILLDFFRTTSLVCICDGRSWLRQCPWLWDRPQSTLGSASTVCTCQDRVHSGILPRSCSAAAIHLVVWWWETVTLTILSANQDIFSKLLLEARDLALQGQEDKLLIYTH